MISSICFVLIKWLMFFSYPSLLLLVRTDPRNQRSFPSFYSYWFAPIPHPDFSSLYRKHFSALGLPFYREDGVSRFLRNFGNFLPDCIASPLHKTGIFTSKYDLLKMFSWHNLGSPSKIPRYKFHASPTWYILEIQLEMKVDYRRRESSTRRIYGREVEGVSSGILCNVSWDRRRE
jgi:hypothetical protein